MNLEQASTQPIADELGPGKWIRTRTGVGLTASERKSLLGIVDLCLLNGSLLVAATVWADFAPSPLALFSYSKWFVTLTLLWWICGTVLDVYNLSARRRPQRS